MISQPSININKYEDVHETSDYLRVVGWGGGSVVTTGGGSGVLGLSGVSHVSDIAVVVVGVVGHGLGAAIGKSNGVGSSNNTVTVIVLLLLESSLGVVIGDSVGELVGRDLSKVSSGISSLHGGVVSGSVVDNWGGGVGGSGVNHRGVVRGSVVDSVDSVVDSVDSSTVQSVGGISNDGSVGSEGLALGGGPVLSLVRFAHCLVADLAVAV